MMEKEHTACYRLFHTYYPISVELRHYNLVNKRSGNATYSTFVTRAYGVSVDEIMKREQNRYLSLNLSPVNLCDYVSLSLPFTFKHVSDARLIYLDILEHMENWIDALGNSFINRYPPELSDFILLNQLAERIFTIAPVIANSMLRDNNLSELDKYIRAGGGVINPQARNHHINLIPKLSKLILSNGRK